MRGSSINYQAAARLIDKGKLPLCLFLHGPEDFLKEDLVKRAASALVAPGLRSFNLSTFDLSEAPLGPALAAAEAFPALGGARMVVVRNADRLKRSKKDLQLLGGRLSNPGAFVCLLLVAADSDLSSSFLQSLPPTLTKVALTSPTESEMDGWLSKRAVEAGFSMTPQARRLLLALAGRSMWRLSNELEKLFVTAMDRKEITEDDVHSIVGGRTDRSPFALADAVAGGNRTAAASVAAELLDRGEAPVALAGLLTWNLVKRWSAAAGRGPAGAARLGTCRRDALLLCEADHALKRSKLESALAAQLLVDALTRSGT